MGLDPRWRTLRELDLAAARDKGAAFRIFKRLAGEYREGTDYVVLHHEADATAVNALREQQRVYANSINVVLLSPAFAAAVLAALQASASR